jgi:hypothetical protein
MQFARPIFDVAFTIRFVKLPDGARLARSQPEGIGVAEQIRQAYPRPNALEIHRIRSKDRK